MGLLRKLSLVIPALNEQARLPYTLAEIQKYLCKEHIDAEVIVVDNGSDDATSVVVQQAAGRFPRLRLLRTDRRGKGLAVRTGVLTAQGDVVIFADADLSWAVEDLSRFMQLVDAQRAPVVIGSREGFGARRVGEPWYRHVMGRVFNRVVQMFVVPGIQDSQCGFKAFDRDAAQSIFRRQSINGFGFDVEVLYLARELGFPIQVVPLQWEHKQHSTVAPVRDTLMMLGDVARVRSRLWRGH